MAFWLALAPLLGPIVKLVGGWVEHKQKMREAKQEGELQWASTMAAASATSWKDEYLVIMWTFPLILAAFGYDKILTNFLFFLERLPDWYTYLLWTITGASFGLNLSDRYTGFKAKTAFINKLNGNGGKPDTYAAVRPDPVPKSDG